MKPTTRIHVILLAFLPLFANPTVQLSAAPFTSAFTYQGLLTEGDAHANGVYDLTFMLCESASGGPVIAGPATNAAVSVSNGLFIVSLDFGVQVFDGETRWLEIGVRPTGASAAFTPLTPRQPLTATPYALYSRAAEFANTSGLATATGTNSVSGPSLQDAAITADKIAAGQVVKSLNGLKDDITLAAGTNVFLSPSDQTLTLSSPLDWHLDGNVGTTGGTHFLGTTDDRPLDLRVSMQRAFRLEPGTNWAPNVVGGSASNSVETGVIGATIAGGGTHGTTFTQFPTPGPIPPFPPTLHPNRVSGNFGSVGGGAHNFVGSGTVASTVSGGYNNTIAEGSGAATISGGANNWIYTNATGATIGGGRDNNLFNGAVYSRIGGGRQNWIWSGAEYVTIAGGATNTVQDNVALSSIGGGWLNTLQDGVQFSTIGGGGFNRIGTNTTSGTIAGGAQNQLGTGNVGSTIGGGGDNTLAANARYGTVPGGLNNTVSGDYGFAAGRRARALHAGSFVWADSANADFTSTAADQFSVRAQGGVRLLTGAAGLTINGETALSGLVEAGQLAAGAVVSSNLATGAVTSTAIADGTITATDVNVGSFSNTFWKVDGNTGTVPGTHFLGTTDNQPLEFKVNGMRALRLEDNVDSSDVGATSDGAPNLIGGAPGNYVGAGVVGATISGGGATLYGLNDSLTNAVLGEFGAVGGGLGNRVGTHSWASTVAGGFRNTIDLDSHSSVIGGGAENVLSANLMFAVIAGGAGNTIGTNSDDSTISGGFENTIADRTAHSTLAGGFQNTIGTLSHYSSIGGGDHNLIADNAQWATIPGGRYNSATKYGFAAGRQAKANHEGSFVWADSTAADFASTTTNEFSVRAMGGVRLLTGGTGLTIDGETALSGLVDPGQLAAGAVVSSNLATGAVTSNALAAAAVTSSAIADGTITAADVNVGSFSNTFWKANGNANTLAGTHFLGTTDNQPVEFKVNGKRVLRLEPNDHGGNMIGGCSSNFVAAGIKGASIGGGGDWLSVNSVFSDYSAIGGGLANTVSVDCAASVIAGGARNVIFHESSGSIIGGGVNNWILGQVTNSVIAGGASNHAGSGEKANHITISGGFSNEARGDYSTIGGGSGNRAAGKYGVVPGGDGNEADGNYSFAAGRTARARHDGAFVWADATGFGFNSSTSNQFAVRASGGALFDMGSSGLQLESESRSLLSRYDMGAASWRITADINADEALEFALNSDRVMRYQVAGTSPNIIGGSRYNVVDSIVTGGVIGGGGDVGLGNALRANYSTIGGGLRNLIDVDAISSTISGGERNTNLASAHFATVPGGSQNAVAGSYSLAAGYRAKANHQGSFVWADSTDSDFTSTRDNQFSVRAGGGVRFVTSGTGLTIDGETALSGLVEIGQLAAGAVVSTNLALGAVTSNAIAAGAVTSTAIADGTIVPADVNRGSFSNTFWKTDGNAGTVTGTHFLGTTDNRALELRANAERAFRVEPGVYWAPNVVGGSSSNAVDAGIIGATIAGGGTYGVTFSQFPTPGPITPFPPTLHPNRISGNFGTVGGGAHNLIGPSTVASTVGGGYDNAVADSSSVATVSGGANNWILTNSTGAAIGGGRDNILLNETSYSRIGGGRQNWTLTGAQYTLIAGGATNTIFENADCSVIGGGWLNNIKSSVTAGTIGGGFANNIQTNSSFSTIAGGSQNEISRDSPGGFLGGGAANLIRSSSSFGTIPGGYDNEVGGNYAFAAGRHAKALHAGSFVWADSGTADFASTANDQFLLRASGGVKIHSPSDFATFVDLLNSSTTDGASGYRLQVVGSSEATRGGNFEIWKIGGQNLLTCKSDGKIGIGTATPQDALLDVEGDIRLNDHDLLFRGTSDRNHGLGWYGAGKPFATVAVDGPVLYGWTGGVLGTLGPQTIALFWDYFGRVGIGTSSPSEKLHVAGNIYATGTITPSSDRNQKTDFAMVDTSAILETIESLPIQQWRFKAEDSSVRHLGPTAQDFHAAFGLGANEVTIATVDADGVALAAIQGLNQKVEKEVAGLRAENEALKRELSDLRQIVNSLTEKLNGVAE